MWSLPVAVEIDGEEHPIRNKCDYRVVLDVIAALNDEDLDMRYRVQCALFIFYEDISKIKNFETAVTQMVKIINNGEDEEDGSPKPRLMDWEHDFKILAPPISRVLGYDIRDPEKTVHWFTFLGGFLEIGECTFQNVVGIRQKRLKGKKLESWEQEFLREHRKMIDLPQKLTAEEKEWLSAEW